LGRQAFGKEATGSERSRASQSGSDKEKARRADTGKKRLQGSAARRSEWMKR